MPIRRYRAPHPRATKHRPPRNVYISTPFYGYCYYYNFGGGRTRGRGGVEIGGQWIADAHEKYTAPPRQRRSKARKPKCIEHTNTLTDYSVNCGHKRATRGQPREGNNHYTHIYAHAQTVYRATASSARHASRARHARYARAHRGGAGCVRYQSAPPRGAGGGGGARGRARLTSCSHATEKVMSQVSELPFYIKYDILLYRERPDGVSVWRKAKGGFGKTQLKDGSYFTGELKAFYM